jgi:hypothetical protein
VLSPRHPALVELFLKTVNIAQIKVCLDEQAAF